MRVDVETLALFFSCLSQTGREAIDVLLRPVAASLTGAVGYSYRELLDDVALPMEWERCGAKNFHRAAAGACMPCFYKLSVTPGTSYLYVCHDTGQTPLIAACRSSSFKSVAHLLLNGAMDHLNFGDAMGCRPLHFVIHSPDMIKRQIDDSDCEHRKGYLKFQLQQCKAGVSKALVAVLAHHGADINARDKEDETPVMHALVYTNCPALRCLCLSTSVSASPPISSVSLPPPLFLADCLALRMLLLCSTPNLIHELIHEVPCAQDALAAQRQNR